MNRYRTVRFSLALPNCDQDTRESAAHVFTETSGGVEDSHRRRHRRNVPPESRGQNPLSCRNGCSLWRRRIVGLDGI
jgi:hypothetical protein